MWASLMEILLYWIPNHEKARLSAVMWSGAYAAPIGAYPLCGFLTKHYGWEAGFYVTGIRVLKKSRYLQKLKPTVNMLFLAGGFSFAWCIIWWIFVSRTPFIDSCISLAEKNFLNEQVKVSPEKKVGNLI